MEFDMKKDGCKYPIVFVHGMFGWGENEGINKKMPYWGASTGSITEYLRQFGYECYAASVGPISSAWDQACELYAQLTGTQVDYGKVHSEKSGHRQFGRTYSKPLFDGWSGDKKIHLVGHSFGGVSIRLLAHLLAYGAPEEVEASGENVSQLFKGGQKDLICSITAISSPLNGTSAYDVAKKIHLYNPLLFTSRYYSCILGRTPLSGKLVDFHLEQFGITNTPGKKDALPVSEAIANHKRTNDHIAFDLSSEGSRIINERVQIVPDIFYFSVPFNAVKYSGKKHCLKAVNTDFILMRMTSNLLIKHSDSNLLSTNYGNDGLVELTSACCPYNEPCKIYEKGKSVQKGVWNIMPVHIGDHGTPIGLFADKTQTRDFYSELIDLLKETEERTIVM